jgi:hypothetical protein
MLEKLNDTTGELSALTIQKELNTIKFTHDFENDMLIILKKK